ncbi:MAG: hypothetical protein F4Z59_07365, partial [Gemmatimonadales bacterium]|nr:hypothetical protein [Gemmatimonadales bacterium]
MRQEQPQRPDGSDPSGRMHRWLRTASFWALLILIPVALLQFMGGAREGRETLSYTQFREQIEQRNIESIQVRLGTGEVEGSLRSAIAVDEAEIANFHLLLPTREIGDALMSELLEADITIETLPARSNWLNVFISILPWIFIIGLWLFVIRQMQAGGSRAFSFGKSKARLLSGATP